MKNWFNKYKVLIVGLLISLFQPINDIIQTGSMPSAHVLVIAAIGGVISWMALNLRGQWVSIAGILQLAMNKYISMDSGNQINWGMIIFQVIIALLALVAPPAKSRGYEHTETIVEAKEEGKQITQDNAQPKT